MLLSLITAGPGIIGVLVVAGILYSETQIAPLFQGKYSGDYTTRIYSAPYRIVPGLPLSPEELKRRLKRLNYARVEQEPDKPGTFKEEDGRFEIYLRGMSLPKLRTTPAKIEVVLDQDKVRSLKHLSGAESRLEPELIYEMSGPQLIFRERLRLDEIAAPMKLAVVAVEDRRFYQHGGLDLRGVARAAIRNFHLKRVAEGGSTLTQQLARTLFLTHERTYPRKAREAMIAFYMETRLPKDQIMRLYLDSVYFGQTGPASVVGLKAAARYFFNKNPKDLSLTECALLAGVVNSPRLFNPFENPDAALRRRNIVLAAMKQEKYITAAQEEKARAQPLGVNETGRYEPKEADYFVAYIQRLWEKNNANGPSLNEGLTLYTTLDPWLQEAAQRAVRKARREAALVALDPASGAIRALVGGKDFSQSPFDRSDQGKRQPGSAFKPFVYGAALEQTFKPDTEILDSPKRYHTARGLWLPKNYDGWYRGKVPLHFALAHSLNAASVRLTQEVGPDKVVEYARRLGIVSPLSADLGLALGVYEASLLELSGAYCAFANGGFRVEPYPVEVALDTYGDVLERHAAQRTRAIEREEAQAMTGMLREVVSSGTAKGLERWGLETIAAGKTGTTDEGKDAWFIGYVPHLLAGVWTGSDIPEESNLSGASAAVPLWADFIRSAVHPGPMKGGQAPTALMVSPAIVRVLIDPETGLLARSGCPNRRMETYVQGTEPKTYCTLHPGGLSGWLRRVFNLR